MTLHLPIADCGEVVLDVPHYFIKLLIGQLGIQCMNTETVLTADAAVAVQAIHVAL